MNPPLAAFEDSTLIELSLAGRAECFEVLMDRHSAAVKRCIGAMVRNRTDAEDLLQNVLLKVWSHLATFRAEASFRTWVTRVAINEVLQSYRRERHQRPFQPLEDLDAFASPCESPFQSLTRVEITELVRNAIATLPLKYRQVLTLRDLEHRTARETAESLQSTVPSVKTRLFRARLLLSSALKQSSQAPGIVKKVSKPARVLVMDRKSVPMTRRSDSDSRSWLPPQAVGM
jgi:RNA polymerase sigma-70 factor (ECF subfamily)